jgi:hypothetical protein
MYAEGATTNGSSIISFRKGAFASLRAVKPYYSKSWSVTGVSFCHGDATSLVAYLSIMAHGLLNVYTVTEMPVFRPNEYFWKHHWDGKEEKWVAYARAV